MTPEKVVLVLLLPTARFFEPRLTKPLPAIDPAVVPPVNNPEMSIDAVGLTLIRVALPPLAVWKTTVALSWPLLVMVAFPAVALLEKLVKLLVPLLVIEAFAAVALLKKTVALSWPLSVIV